MCKFERSLRGILLCSTSILLIILGSVLIFYTHYHHKWDSWDYMQDKLYFKLCLIFVIFLLSAFILRPDDKYTIKLLNTDIIFEFSNDDRRIISKSFTIAKKTRNYIILDDGITRIKIAYNKEVLEFLEEIQKN